LQPDKALRSPSTLSGDARLSEAQLASVRRALGVLLREGLVIGSTARRQGDRKIWAAPEYARRLWFWIECDYIERREPFGWQDDDHAVVDRDTRIKQRQRRRPTGHGLNLWPTRLAG
jgi:hypothetical protein